jgi:hypothetical protein
MKRSSLVIIVLLVVIGGMVYLNQHKTTNDQLLTISEMTMGTSYHVKLAPTAEQKINLPSLKEQISVRLADIDNKMSKYKKKQRFPVSIVTQMEAGCQYQLKQ